MESKIILGDCLEVMKTMPDKSVDLVLTDPPYGTNQANGTVTTYGSSTINGKEYSGDWDNKTPSDEVFDEILRIGKKVIIFGGQFFKLPLNGHWIVWDKKGDIVFDNPFGDCELAWTNIDRKSVKKYTVIQQGFVSEERVRFHPTQKPVSLFEQLINDYSEAGESIFDPFLGSGTSAIASKLLQRDFTGIEISPEYVKIAQDRLSALSDPLF